MIQVSVTFELYNNAITIPFYIEEQLRSMYGLEVLQCLLVRFKTKSPLIQRFEVIKHFKTYIIIEVCYHDNHFFVTFCLWLS